MKIEQNSKIQEEFNRWSDLNSDPNSPLVKKASVEKLKVARQSRGITDRVSWIAGQCKGLNILDIGVVEHTLDHAASPEWLHGRIVRVAANCLGIDILKSGVDSLARIGYNIRVHDLTRAPLGQRFDLAVMGDVLEHLSNPGDFLRNLGDSLIEDGRVIISAPNPWYFIYPLRNILKGCHYYESADHVAWYDPNTIQELFSREGYSLVSYRGVVISNAKTIKGKILIKLVPLLLKIGFSHELFSKTMIYVFQKDKKTVKLS
jgi:2-polyprenyl-3-methyl-5-hydroxy-6-metoxy-1,4-benzoquinol methylase